MLFCGKLEFALAVSDHVCLLQQETEIVGWCGMGVEARLWLKDYAIAKRIMEGGMPSLF